MKREDTIRPLRALVAEYNVLPEGSSERLAAQRLMEHIADVPTLSVEAAAGLCALSISSLRRFCRRLGYTSFTEFKQKVARDLASYRYSRTMVPRLPEEDLESAAMRTLKTAFDGLLASLNRAALEAVTVAMHEARTVHFHDRMFSNLLICLQADLSVCRVKIRTARFSDAQRESLAQLRQEDLLLLVAHSEQQAWELLPQVEEAGATGATIAAIVPQSCAEAFSACSYCLTYPDVANEQNCFLTDLLYNLIFRKHRERYLKDFRFPD